ncbi:MAG: iron ABC transporter permease [Burkholderiales bacterium]|nr:iron ABC transporter permease [Burkholderiales bacterium]
MHTNRRGMTALAATLALLAVLPVAAIVGRGLAFGAGDTWSHLAATVLPRYIGNTLALVVLVGTGVAVGGTAAGWLVARRRFPGSRLFEWALLLPLAMPSYVMAYAYTDFLQYAGPLQTTLRETFGWSHGDYWLPEVRSLPGAALMFVFTLYPYVFLLARTAFLERPPALVEAARTLGLDRRAAFWRVELPLARPAIAAGIALALMETLADYGTVSYFAVDTFTTGVYRAWFSLGDRTAAAQLATALLVFVVAAVALERASRGAARTYGGARGKQTHRQAPQRLTGMRAAAATSLCAIALAIGFVFPVLLLLRLMFAEAEVALTARFLEWGWNSFRVALLASVLALMLATFVTYALRLAPGAVTRSASRVLNLGYAVPGTVLAVGVLLPLGAVDNVIAAWLRETTGRQAGLLLTGTTFALIYAYLVRYFAVAWNGIEPGFARITPAMDAAARSLGAGAWETLRRVHAPLLVRSGAAALLLAFVDVMKELPATLVLRPFNFDTLATQTYLLAKDERLAEAALPSLAMVAVGLVPIIVLARMSRRKAGAITRAIAAGTDSADAPAVRP